MIFRLIFEKADFKVMQNLTSNLQFSGFLFSGTVVSSCLWWRSHHFLCSLLRTVYLLSTHFSFEHAWHYIDYSWVKLVEFSMARFGVFSNSQLPLCCLLMFNTICQYFFLWFVNISTNNPIGTHQGDYYVVSFFWHSELCKFSFCYEKN